MLTLIKICSTEKRFETREFIKPYALLLLEKLHISTVELCYYETINHNTRRNNINLKIMLITKLLAKRVALTATENKSFSL